MIIQIWAAGNNQYNQLAIGNAKASSKFVETNDYKKINIKQIAGGYWHVLVLTREGEINVIGKGENGQLGLGETDTKKSLTKLAFDDKIVKIATCNNSSFAVSSKGEVFAWGANEYLQISPEPSIIHSLKPILIEDLKGKHIVTIKTGMYNVIVQTDQNEFFSWGYNESGQCKDFSFY